MSTQLLPWQLVEAAGYDCTTTSDPLGKLMLDPNVLTIDKGTSKLAQAPIAQTALVEVERLSGALPEISAFEQPVTA